MTATETIQDRTAEPTEAHAPGGPASQALPTGIDVNTAGEGTAAPGPAQPQGTGGPVPYRTRTQQRLANFDLAFAVIDGSEALAFMDAHTLTLAPSGKPLGAPAAFDNRALAVTMLAAALSGDAPVVTAYHAYLNDLPDDRLGRLGLKRDHKSGQAATISQVSHRFNRLTEAFNPSPVRDGKSLRKDDQGRPVLAAKQRVVDRKCLRSDAGATAPPAAQKRRVSSRGAPRPLGPDEAAARQKDLDELGDLLLRETVPRGLPYDALGIDWTDMPTAARPATKRRTSADPDARWGYRSAKKVLPGGAYAKAGAGTDGLRPDGSEQTKKERFFGYISHIGTLVGPVGAPDLPAVAVSYRFRPANDMAGTPECMTGITAAAIRTGIPVEEIIVDRGYSMHGRKAIDDAAANLGVFVTRDYTEREYQVQGTHKGAIIRNDTLYCPYVKFDEDLRPPGPSAGRAEWATYWARRSALDAWAFRPQGRPEPGGTRRMACPAYAGKGRCVHCPGSAGVAAEKPDLDVHMPPGAPRLACCGGVMNVRKDEAVGWRRQRYPHGSPDWVDSYNRRATSERHNAAEKNTQRLGAMDILVLGLAKRALIAVFAAMATNLRLVASHEARVAAGKLKAKR